MTNFQAVVLGLVQGLTEFLPISSSAHLILASYLLGWEDQGLSFDIAAHLGSMLAVLVYLRSDFLAMASSVFGKQRNSASAGFYRRVLLGLLVATLPVAVVGFLMRTLVATTLRNPWVIATASIVFGVLLFISDRFARHRRTLDDLGLRDSILIGCAQALALVPGTSRAGITMTAALGLGFDREATARFSFLLALPVSVLVAVRQLMDLSTALPSTVSWTQLGLGFALSSVSAYLAMGALVAWVRKQGFSIFVVYRVVLGLILFGQLLA